MFCINFFLKKKLFFQDFFLVFVWPTVYGIYSLYYEMSLYLDPLREMKKAAQKKHNKNQQSENLDKEQEENDEEQNEEKKKDSVDEKKNEPPNGGYENKITRKKKLASN